MSCEAVRYLDVKRRKISSEGNTDVVCWGGTVLENEPESPFASLLPELLEVVFSYLGVTDKGRASCVCRHWRRVCYSRFLWEKEEAKLDLQQTTKQALRSIHERGITKIQILSFNSSFTYVTKSFSNLHCLRLSGCYNTTDAMLRKAFSSLMNNLKECDLSFCKQITDRGLKYVVSKAPNIEKLNLAGCINITNQGITICCAHCRNIRYLSLAGCKLINSAGLRCISQPLVGMCELQELDLQGCGEVKDSGLLYISQGLTKLESLTLSFCLEVTNEGIAHIASGLLHLKKLYLRSCRRIGDGTMYSLATHCPTLEHLDVSFCHRIRDTSLNHLAQGLPNLKSLQLSACNISDSGVLALAQSLHGLRHLSIGQCERLTDRSLGYIAEYMTNLESIDLYGCTKLSSDGMRDILSKLSQLKQLSLSLT